MGGRVATMSVVVRADGVSEAFYNGQRDRVVEAVRAEAAERIKQAQADAERERDRADRERDRADRERDRADRQTRKCNLMRGENLKRLSEELNRKRGFKDWITYTWAIVWTMASAAVLMVWIYLWLILYALKLVEYDWDYEPGDD